MEQETEEQAEQVQPEAKPQPPFRLDLGPPNTPAFGLSEATVWAVEVLYTAPIPGAVQGEQRLQANLLILTPSPDGSEVFGTVQAVLQRIAPEGHSPMIVALSRRSEARGGVTPMQAGSQ